MIARVFRKLSSGQALEGDLAWFIRQNHKRIRALLPGIALLVFGSCTALLDPMVMRWLIDKVLPSKSLYGLGIAVFLFMISYVGRGVFVSVGDRYTMLAIQHLMLSMREHLLRHIFRLPAAYHDTTPVGEQLQYFQDTIQDLGLSVSAALIMFFRTSLLGLMCIYTMCILDFKLTLVMVVAVPSLIYVINKSNRQLRLDAKNIYDAKMSVASSLQEQLTAIVQLRLLNAFGKQMKRAVEGWTEVKNAEDREKRTEVWSSILTTTIGVALMAAIIGGGGVQVIRGALTIGSVVAFYGYALKLYEPMYMSVEVSARWTKIKVSIRAIRDLYRQYPVPTIVARRGAIPSGERMYIALDNVGFSYKPGNPVLRDVNLLIEPGECTGLFGLSRSGKSTLAKLIANLYRPDCAIVMINGMDARDIDPDELYNYISYVPQKSTIFNLSLEENLIIGEQSRASLDLSDVTAAIGLGPIVKRLPNGLRSSVGPGGNLLSGGERQRISIGRALIRHPSVLILDEATSELDTPSEQQ